MLTRADLLEQRDDAVEKAALARRDTVDALNQLADVYVVLARWGIDIDRGHPAALVEHALRIHSHQLTHLGAAS